MDAATAARSFILQSPPGELNDCLADCRGIMGDDILAQGVLPALEQYNMEQLVVVDLPDEKHQLIVCRPGQLAEGSNRYVDPRSRKSLVFDHLQSTVSEPEAVTVDEQLETTREVLQQAAISYVDEHLHNGVAAVFAPLPKQPAPKVEQDSTAATPSNAEAESQQESAPQEDALEAAEAEVSEPVNEESAAIEAPTPSVELDHENIPPLGTTTTESEEPDATVAALSEEAPPVEAISDEPEAVEAETMVEEPQEPLPRQFDIVLVGNKYNPGNFWTGRWRASYQVSIDKQRLTGEVHVNVHYYEQGNVQLSTSKTVEASITASEPAALAKEVFKIIGAAEKELQIGINEAHVEMNDRTLKDLRRTLPLTKSKLDWNRIASFRTAKELKRGA